MIQRSFCVFLLIRRNTNVTTIQRLHYYFIQKRLFSDTSQNERHYDTTIVFYLPRRYTMPSL